MTGALNLDWLDLEPTGEHTYRAQHAGTGHSVVFGGQLLGQMIVAGARGHEGKTVKTIHTVFARGASYDAPLDVTVDPMHAGRAFASSTVTISQGDTLCCRAIVLLSGDDEDTIRHGADMPQVDPPEASKASETELPGWECAVVGGIDVVDPDAPTSTGVIGHTLTFHEPVHADQWLLLAHHSPYAGRGRSYGTADVFDQQGNIVASFVQDAMIRGRSGGPGKL
jgi:acyl-CoA thioesterase-2